MEKPTAVDDLFSIPSIVGIPTYAISILIGIVEAVQGSLTGGALSVVMTILGGIYMFKKIQGQHLDNVKKKLR